MIEFVNAIFEPSDQVELRAIKTSGAKKIWSQAGDLHQLTSQLQAANKENFNIYFGPNPRKGHGMSGDESVDLCRCLFADFDNLHTNGQPLSDIALARIADAGLPLPTATVHSGHGVHCYWRLLAPLEPGFWCDTQQRLNATVKSDPSIKNPERLMRLPGFINVKSEPFVKCEIVSIEPSLAYDIDGFGELLVELEPEPATEPVPTTDRPKQMEHKARAMLYASKWKGVPEGQGRNNAAYAHACQLRRDFDLPDYEAWEILQQWNTSNSPPLSEKELRQAFDGAIKYGNRPAGSKLNQSHFPDGKQQQATPIDNPPDDPLAEMDEYIEGVGTGRIRTVNWPWFLLGDGTQALSPGTVTILSGGPGASKSLFFMQAIRYWLKNGESVRYYGMEGVRSKYLMRCLAQLAGNSEFTKTSYVKEHHRKVKQVQEEYKTELTSFSKCLRVARDMKADYLDQISAWIHEQAKAGIRIIGVDPITLALRTGKAWECDQRFVRDLTNTCLQYQCNVVIVTHPEKNVEDPSLHNLAGGASYSRFSDNVFTIKMHERKESQIITSAGRCEVDYNQTIQIAKAREGSLVGSRLAFEFDGASLTTKEIGLITKG